MTPAPSASTFDLSCAECTVTVRIDTAEVGWANRLSAYASDHADHVQMLIPVTEAHEAAS